MVGGKRSWKTGGRGAIVTQPAAELLPRRGADGGTLPSQRPLFRQEVLDFQHLDRQWGHVLPLQPLSTRLMLWIVLAASACIIAFLFVGQYARKEVAVGYLTPSSGTARVFAPQPGIISAVFARQGQQVSEGQPLLAVTTSQIANSNQDVNTTILDTLKQQAESLRHQIAEEVGRNASEHDRLTAQKQEFESELANYAAQQDIVRARIRLLEQSVAAGAELRRTGLVSEVDQRHRQETLLGQQQALVSMDQEIMALKGRLIDTRFNLQQLPITLAEKIRGLRDELAAGEQRMAEINGRRSYIVRAPISGRISILQSSVGQQVDPQRLQLQIVPNDSPLEARLFIPTTAIGLVEVGQNVRLLYDAFPYQRFGTYHGRIISVSRTVLMDSDIVAPLKLNQPVYTATVSLDRTDVDAHGRKVPLQPDMSLRADIILEKRSLIDWIIGPLKHLGVDG